MRRPGRNLAAPELTTVETTAKGAGMGRQRDAETREKSCDLSTFRGRDLPQRPK